MYIYIVNMYVYLLIYIYMYINMYIYIYINYCYYIYIYINMYMYSIIYVYYYICIMSSINRANHQLQLRFRFLAPAKPEWCNFWGHHFRKMGCTGDKGEKLRTSVESLPIGSMYGIYTNSGGILMVNVNIYSIHGSYGL